MQFKDTLKDKLNKNERKAITTKYYANMELDFLYCITILYIHFLTNAFAKFSFSLLWKSRYDNRYINPYQFTWLFPLSTSKFTLCRNIFSHIFSYVFIVNSFWLIPEVLCRSQQIVEERSRAGSGWSSGFILSRNMQKRGLRGTQAPAIFPC